MHISWSRNSQLIQNGTNLLLKRLKIEDSGTYICSATNEVGEAQKVFYVNVVEPPEIFTSLHNVTLFTNQTKSVSCHAKGTPDPKVYWTYDGVKVEEGTVLSLDSSMKSGSYICVAENLEGRVERSFFFHAVNKPTLVNNYDELKKEIKLRENDGLELICPFENYDSISWSFDNDTIESFPHDKSDNKLILHKIDRQASGEWRCSVTNLAGSESFAFNVTVSASPVIHASWNLNNRVSDFLVTESDIDEKTFQVGERLALNCTAHGFPKPKVLWRKSIDLIGEGETLIINNLQFHHSDIYTCSAENDQGVVKKFFKIDVVSPPFIDDIDLQQSFQKSVGESLTLRCRVIANPVPNIFWFKNK